MSKCCCVVLNYNDAAGVENLLKNINKYDIFSNILIVDNCSTDDSYTKLKMRENSKITVIRTERNGGYGYGNNFGIRYAKEELNCTYAVISNPDVFFECGLVDEMLAIAQQNEAAVVTAVQYDKNNVPIADIAWKLPGKVHYMVANTFFERIWNCNYSSKYFSAPVCEVDCVPGAFLLVDINKFLDVGGYDEEVFLYCEESILGYRLKEKKYKTYLLINKNYRHEHSVTVDKNIPSVVRQYELIFESRRYYLKKYLNADKITMWLAERIQKAFLYRRRKS